jgi:phosphate transport system substrate-binding protein
VASILRRLRVPAAVLAGFALVAAACGDDSGGGGGGVSGSVLVSGSSTVEPITSLVAENFQGENPGVTIQVDGPGTTDGFVLFCDGETDISDASRAIDPEEEMACADGGVNYVELYIAIDGLSVIVPSDSPVECLTFNDLYAIFGPESADFSTWGEAAELSTSLGGETGIPEELDGTDLNITRPGEESGTYGSFIEIVTEPIAEEQGVGEDEAGTLAVGPFTQQSGNDNFIVDGVAGSGGGVGFVGIAFAEENSDRIKEAQVDGGDGCVAPDEETISSGEYPISRPLFIYPNTDKAAENDSVTAFVDYYLSDTGYDLVPESGYVQIPQADWDATNQAWEDAKSGGGGTTDQPTGNE